jgi:hypothetical protein
VVVTSHAAVARRYLRGWFAVDLVTTMPWDTMVIALVERCSLEDGAPAHVSNSLRGVCVKLTAQSWSTCQWIPKPRSKLFPGGSAGFQLALTG